MNGEGKWLNTSTYQFSAQPALSGGIDYTVSVDPNLKAVDGGALEDDGQLTWSFSTVLPALVSIQPDNGTDLYLDANFSLTFNQPMDTGDVEAKLKLVDPGGKAVAATYSWQENDTIVTLTPDQLLQRDTDYSLSMEPVRSAGGSLADMTVNQPFHTIAGMAVQSVQPAPGKAFQTYSDYGFITLTMTAPIAEGQNMGDLVQFNPRPGNFNISGDFPHGAIFISGLFEAATDYKLTVSGQLQDIFGDRLGEDYQQTFHASNDQPTLSIPYYYSSTGLYALPGATSIQGYVTNLNQVNHQESQPEPGAIAADLQPGLFGRQLPDGRHLAAAIEPDRQRKYPGQFGFQPGWQRPEYRYLCVSILE